MRLRSTEKSLSHLKNRILVQVQGGAEFQPADILKYFEELKRGPNTEVGTKDLLEMASHNFFDRKIKIISQTAKSVAMI